MKKYIYKHLQITECQEIRTKAEIGEKVAIFYWEQRQILSPKEKKTLLWLVCLMLYNPVNSFSVILGCFLS